MKNFDDEVLFNGPVTFSQLPKEFVGAFVSGDVTPSVLNAKVWKSTGNAVVTDFDNGMEGQEISILGNGTITVSHNANIKTNTGANKVLAANRLYRFVLIDGVWYEQ